ncbi:MAG TPA: hypothetical protein DEP87_02430 [Candidatus Pacebacteria bacterium]|nr:hypothetical protein [Candidatus Paceibacterota bacterium]
MIEFENEVGREMARRIDSAVLPVLPDIDLVKSFKEAIRLDISESSTSESTLLSFYYPLLAVAYRLSKVTLDRLMAFPVLDEQSDQLQSWFFSYLQQISQLLELAIARLNESLDENYDQQLVAYLDQYTNSPFQWNSITATWMAQWLALVLDKANHQGKPPYYVYVNEKSGVKFPQLLPRVFEGGGWLSGFGGRLLVLPGIQNLSGSQKAEIWNKLLTAENIYDDKTIDHSVRQEVFDAIIQLLPTGNIVHLDLCGGKGDFINYLSAQRQDVISVLIDNADKAVELARQSGISAQVGNADEVLQTKQVDAVTIIFAVQWISSQAFVNVLDALKPGGCLIANVYPPDLKEIEVRFMDLLRQIGFINLQLKTVEAHNGTKQFIIKAQKPEDKPA